MKYTARKFQQNQYDKCDSISRKVFVEFIENRGHTIVSKEEDYNHDIVTEKDGVHHYFELETKKDNVFLGNPSLTTSLFNSKTYSLYSSCIKYIGMFKQPPLFLLRNPL